MINNPSVVPPPKPKHQVMLEADGYLDVDIEEVKDRRDPSRAANEAATDMPHVSSE